MVRRLRLILKIIANADVKPYLFNKFFYFKTITLCHLIFYQITIESILFQSVPKFTIAFEKFNSVPF